MTRDNPDDGGSPPRGWHLSWFTVTLVLGGLLWVGLIALGFILARSMGG